MRIYADPADNPAANSVKSENPNAFSDSLTNPTEKEKLKELHGKKKREYIWDYYKIPIIGVLIVLFVISYMIYGRLTAKENILSVTCTNMLMNEEQVAPLVNNYLTEYLELSPSRYRVVADTSLLVGENDDPANSEYAYTSQMKLTAYVSAGELDIMIMDEKGFEYLSARGFLQDLSEVFAEMDPSLNETLKDSFVFQDVIIEDNSAEILMGSSDEYEAVIENHPFGLKLNGSPLFPEETTYIPVYAGICTNSSRTDASLQFLHYLYGLEPGDFQVIPEKK